VYASAGVDLPDGWRSLDIGAPSLPGASAHAAGAFSVAGGGLDIWHSADQFHFTYTRAAGDIDVVTRITEVDHLHPLMKAGVMIRASASADATHAFVFTLGGRRFDFARRQTAGAWTRQDDGPPGDVPEWLKLERRGSVVSAYVSENGVNWTYVGGDVVDLPREVLVGLAVTSRHMDSVATAVFDRVMVWASTSPEALEPAPVSSPAPEPAPMPEPGTTEPDSTRAPTPELEPEPEPAPIPAAAPEPEPAPQPEPVSTAAPASRWLLFEPSSDHATNVSGYVMEVARASAPASPVLSHDLGKPVVSGGDCQVDVGGLLAQLGTGSYIVIVKAYNRYGSSAAATASLVIP
jgi:hypothetical protein